MRSEPILDVAHLGHVELLTNKPEASLHFFINILGLSESGREGGSVYLRAFDDYEFHSLKLTASTTTGVRHTAYRAVSPAALQRRVRAIEELGAGIGWTEGDLGHGPAYRFRDPDGHEFEIYYETRRYEPGQRRGRPSRTKPSGRRTAASLRAVWTTSISWRAMSTRSAVSFRRRSAAASRR
jgi:catechol 2,3-dioxygenase